MGLLRWLRPSTRRLDDPALRARKAQKIVAVLARELGDLSARTCLDVGCAAGLITDHLAERFRATIGVEQDRAALVRARARQDNGGRRPALFVCGDAEGLPIADGGVDVVVCSQVYEHVAHAERLFGEIRRVLAPGGVCFFSGPNAWFPLEMHTGLPGIHWLPRSWAAALARWLGRGEYDARPLTVGGLRRRLRGFTITDYTAAMVRHPHEYACDDELGRLAWLGALPGPLLRALLAATPNVNWVLRAEEGNDGRLPHRG